MNAVTTRILAQEEPLLTTANNTLSFVNVITLSNPAVLLCTLLLSVIISAFSVITLSDNHREVTGLLSTLQQEHSQLETRYGQLLLEENTLASPIRVEKMAKQNDNMTFPTAQQVVMITQ